MQWEEEEVVTYLERHWPRLYHSRLFQGMRAVVLSDAFQWGALHPHEHVHACVGNSRCHADAEYV